MMDTQKMKLKICLVGEGAVGKTSVIRKYVFDEFDDSYITTIGTKVTKKEIEIQHPSDGNKLELNLLIWDIMGQKGFRQLLQEAYFHGAQGLIAVCDVTNKDTLIDLEGWVEAATGVTGEVPTVFLANKCDLVDEVEFGLDELKAFISRYEGSTVYQSSAKTGENVIEAFKTISTKILEE